MAGKHSTFASLLAIAALGFGGPTAGETGRAEPRIRHIARRPAEDTGSCPRATNRRATRNERRWRSAELRDGVF